MAGNTVIPIDENLRRYYLDAMGIQCWQLIDAPALAEETLPVNTVVNETTTSYLPLVAAIQQCDKCQLHTHRKQAIVGRGDASAELMFVLLSPDANDDQTAKICSGEANNLLGKMLAAINVAIDDVYITSLLKCSVPARHTVSTTELHHCNNYLKQQIALVQPKLIIVLGETTARCMLQNNMTLDDLRAVTNTSEKNTQFESIPLFVSYSPQELLNDPAGKRKAWSDLQQIQKIIQS